MDPIDRQNRPRVTLTIPQYSPHTPQIYTAQTAGLPPNYNGYANPFSNMYSQKAGTFMFQKFEGFRDFTMNTAKSGLSVGEKSAFWIYEKFSNWSKKWFTHIFLFLVVLCYSLAGAAIFIAIEGTNEQEKLDDIEKARYDLIAVIRKISLDDEIMSDEKLWTGRIAVEIQPYQKLLYENFQKGIMEQENKKPMWTFFNAMFYCGTIYTTIGKF